MDPVPEAEAVSQNYTVLVNSMDGATEPGGCATQTPTTCFQPSEVTINVGDSVTWVHNGPAWADRNYQLMGAFVNIDHYHCDGPGRVYHPETTSCPPTHPDNITGQSPPSSWTYTFNSSVDHYYTEWSLQYSAANMGTVRVWDSGAPSPSAQENALTDSTPPIISLDPATVVNWPEHWYASNSTGLNISFGTLYYDYDDAGAPGIVLTRQCSPASNYLFPIGTTTVTCTATDAAENVGTMSFDVTVNAPPNTTPPTVTASAYLNSTSSTGRTLSLNGDDLDPGVDYFSNRDGYEYLKFHASISKDNAAVIPVLSFYEWLLPLSSDCLDPGVTGSGDYSSALAYGVYQCADGWQIPIPTDWASGTYSIAWETDLTYDPNGSGGTPLDASGSTSVTVPVRDTTPPTVTFNGPSGSDGSLDTEVRTALNSTGYSFYWEVKVNDDEFSMSSSTVDDDEAVVLSCFTGDVTIPAIWGEYGGKTWNQPSSVWHFHHTFGVNPTPGHTVTCAATDDAGNTSSESFVFKVLEPLGGSDPIPTVIASAYINGTSPTGRTFHMFGTDVVPALEHYDNSVSWTTNTVYFTATISSDATNSVVWGCSTGQSWWQCAEIKFRKSIEYNSTWPPGIEDGWQTPIPTDWVAGTYTVAWEASPNNDDWTGSVSVTVPALPGDTAADATAVAEIVIPSWIKNNAGWWADGQIDDRAFVSGLQWLISNGIMHIPPTEQGTSSDDVIPSWIKNNAEWWADDLIDDRNFVTGLQWLITNGIMIIELE